MLTLNQVISRIETLADSHSQVQSFHFLKKEIEDFLTGDIVYPTILCDIQDGGGIDARQKTATVPVTLFFLDLENMSDNSRGNTLEVWSDRISVAQDFIAMMDNGTDYKDWRVDGGVNMRFYSEKYSDYVAGVSVDLNIKLPYDVNRCQAPTE